MTAQAPPEAPARARARMLMGALALAVFLASLDQTMVATALPTMASELGAMTSLSAIVTAYLVAACIATPLAGKLGDRYGLRATFIGATVIFALGSLACALAGSMPQMVLGRSLQGAGAGAAMTLSFALIAESVSESLRARYQGFIGSVFGLAAIGGPVIGGLITEHASWRVLFWVNLPVAAVVIVVVALAGATRAGRRQGRLDIAGALLMAGAVACVLLSLDRAGTAEGRSSPLTVWLFAASAVLGAAFVWVERRAEDPIVPLRLLAHTPFLAPVAVGALTAMSLFSAITFLPLQLQIVQRIDIAESGLLLAPFMLAVVVLSSAAGALAGRWRSYRWFPRLGTTLAALAMVGFALLGPGSPRAFTIATMIVFGAGVGMTMQLIVLAAQNAAPADNLGIATALVMFMRSIGAVIGVAVFGSVMASATAARLAGIPAAPDPADLGQAAITRLPAETADAVTAAMAEVFQTTFILSVIPVTLAIIAAFFVRDKQKEPSP